MTRNQKTLLAALLLALFAAPVASAAEAERSPELTAAVKASLNEEKVNSYSRLQVESDVNGVVWLRGTVDSKAEADRAVALAKAVANVKSVNSELEVKPEVTEDKSERSSN